MPELYDYQVEGVKRMVAAKYFILGDEQGIGKTAQAVKAMMQFPGINIIVCPGMLRSVWVNELEKWGYQGEVQVFKKRSEPLATKNGVYIISYNLLAYLDIPHRCIIFDECQYLKNVKSQRTQLSHGLVFARKPEACFALSGTPIKNHTLEFYSILKLMSYCPTDTNGIRIPENSQYAFSTRFSMPRIKTIYTRGGREREVTEFVGMRNIPLLKEYLAGKYLRRLAANVLDLPDMITKEINLDGKKKTQKALDVSYRSYMSGVKDTVAMGAKMESAMEKTGHTATYAYDLFDQGEASVIFTDHIKPCITIAEHLKDKGMRVGVIRGGVSNDKRDDMVAKFQQGDLDVLVCTIGAASTGITLTRARNLIFNDIAWGYVDLDQARKRIHRVSQNRSCIIHYMLSGDVDESLTRRVVEKANNLRKAL